MGEIISRRGKIISDPPIARWLFENTETAWIWLILRVYIGWQWIEASIHKLNDPAWMQTGVALQGFWGRAAGVGEGAKPLTAFDWYAQFLQFLLNGGHYVWFAKLIAFGELTVGVLLIVGAFVGVAAFFGALMNWNFMMAGSASTNPLLFAIAVLLLLAWKTAGYWGVDRYLLPLLGTPWSRKATDHERGDKRRIVPQVQGKPATH